MQASIVDLRYKAKDVLRALDRNESVEILYRGVQKGKIIPTSENPKERKNIKSHPFFGMYRDEEIDVASTMDTLRGGRFAL